MRPRLDLHQCHHAIALDPNDHARKSIACGLSRRRSLGCFGDHEGRKTCAVNRPGAIHALGFPQPTGVQPSSNSVSADAKKFGSF